MSRKLYYSYYVILFLPNTSFTEADAQGKLTLVPGSGRIIFIDNIIKYLLTFSPRLGHITLRHTDHKLCGYLKHTD